MIESAMADQLSPQLASGRVGYFSVRLLRLLIEAVGECRNIAESGTASIHRNVTTGGPGWIRDLIPLFEIRSGILEKIEISGTQECGTNSNPLRGVTVPGS
jgi:hypothetical protein